MASHCWWRSWVRCGIVLLVVTVSVPLWSEKPEAPTAQPVPVINGDAGPCSVEITVNDGAGNPVYAAKIRVHVSHGFLGLRKTDLEIGTNADGKAKFIGLPNDRDEVLTLRASKGKKKGTAVYDPTKTCEAKHFIVLH